MHTGIKLGEVPGQRRHATIFCGLSPGCTYTRDGKTLPLVLTPAPVVVP
jgi:hypothetical protein